MRGRPRDRLRVRRISAASQAIEAGARAQGADEIAAASMTQGQERRVGMRADGQGGGAGRPEQQAAKRRGRRLAEPEAVRLALAGDGGNLKRCFAEARVGPRLRRAPRAPGLRSAR